MTTTAPAIVKPQLVEVLCPVCLPRRNVIIRAARGAIVEAYCWKCKYRKVIVVA